MFDLIVNELVYLTIIVAVLFIIERFSNTVLKFKKKISLSLVIVSIHFLTSFTLTLLNIADIWFPFIFNINSDFPRPEHEFDMQNLIFALVLVYSVNLFGLLWGLYNYFKKS